MVEGTEAGAKKPAVVAAGLGDGACGDERVGGSGGVEEEDEGLPEVPDLPSCRTDVWARAGGDEGDGVRMLRAVQGAGGGAVSGGVLGKGGRGGGGLGASMTISSRLIA